MPGRPPGHRSSLAVDQRGPLEGEESRVVLSVEDVTEFKEHERRLERRTDELETELREIFGRISDGFYALDEEWRYAHVNERAEELLGYSADELLGEAAWDVFPEVVGSDLYERFHDAMETGEPVSFERYSEPLDIWAEVHAYPSETGLSVYFRDVTERKERELELERYERIVETVGDAIYVVDEDQRFTMVNRAAVELSGYSREQLLGARVADMIGEAAAVQADELAEALSIEGGEVASAEFTLTTADDSEVPIDARFTPLPTTDETVKRVGVARDISEQRERERALEESESRYRTLVENFPDGAVGLFDEELRYTAIGGQLVDALDVAQDDRIGHSILDVYPESLVEEVEPYFHAALEGESSSFEADLHDRHLLAYTLPVRNADEEVHAGMLVVQDITDREEIERELRESEAKFRMLAENLEEIVWMATPDAEEWIYVNPAFEDVWGLDRRALYEDSLSFLEAVHREDRERVREAFTALPDDEFDEEFRIVRPDGEVQWVYVRGASVADGGMTRIVGIGQDVTERKRREQQLEEVIEKLAESNERLEGFAYAASHDLQEPLRMISSYLQLIERRYGDVLDEDGEEFLAFAVDGAERMRDMIDALLQYSRIETQGEPLEPVALDDVLDDVRDDLGVQIEERDAEITAERLPRVEGDRSQLRQVFQNLLHNAMEYSGDEPPRVHVAAEQREASRAGGNEEWVISIRDEGIGIDPAEQERVFQMFQRGHSIEEHPGTGIGLALCERIVERHDGDIWVESEPGEGSTFSFTLPAAGGRTDE